MARVTDILARLGLDSSGFKNGLSKSKAAVKKFSDSAIGQFVKVGAAFAGIGLIKGIAKLGLAAGETASKFRAVFGPATDEMNKKVQKLRETIPSTTAEMQNALSTFAAMAKGFGLNTEAARLFSVEMVKIAGDIASFHDLPIEEAFLKIRSAVSGEFEPLKQLGIVINEARLKQEGLSLAIWDGTGAMSAAQKALAVQSIMIRDMGSANGDAAATANSAANRVKFLRAELMETGTQIGTTALPAILSLTEGLAAMLEKTKEFTDFAGTTVGEMIYGKSDKTIERGKEMGRVLRDQMEAVKQLNKEGKLLRTNNSFRSDEKLIKDRTAQVTAARRKEVKDAEEARKKESEAAIKGASDLGEELENQASEEKDPKRKKALLDRLAAYRALIKAAGKLNSLQGVKPATAAQAAKEANTLKIQGLQLELIKAQALGKDQLINAAQRELDKEKKIQSIIMSTNVSRAEAIRLESSLSGQGVDANKSGITTGREQRAFESAGRKKASEARRARTMEVAAESGSGERERKGDRDKRMTVREKAAGLFLAGGDPMGGRRAEGMTADQAKNAATGGKDDEVVKVKDEVVKVNETLGKLNAALSGD